MQSAAFDASTPPIATTGTVTDMQISCEPVEPDRRGRRPLRRRRPDRAGADVGGARELGDGRLAARRGREAEQEPRRERPLGALVAAAEVDAVGPELERRLDVVVDDERRVELPERPPDLDQLRRRRALQAQLDDGRAAGDRGLRGREVLDDRVHSHRIARVQRVRVERGERVVERDVERARAPGTRRPLPRPRRRRRRAPRRRPRAAPPASPARKQPVSALDMQPVPVTAASSGSPFATAITVSPSETWSTGPVTAATSPSERPACAREIGGLAARADRLDAANLCLDADERRDLARVAAQHRNVDLGEDPAPPSPSGTASRPRRPGRARPGSRARSRPCPASSIASTQCSRERADVQHERARRSRPSPRPPRARAPSRAARRARASRWRSRSSRRSS